MCRKQPNVQANPGTRNESQGYDFIDVYTYTPLYQMLHLLTTFHPELFIVPVLSQPAIAGLSMFYAFWYMSFLIRGRVYGHNSFEDCAVMSIMHLCFCCFVLFWLSGGFSAVFPELQITLSAQSTSFHQLSFLFHNVFQGHSRIREYLTDESIS